MSERVEIYKQIGDSINEIVFYPPTVECNRPSPVLLLIPGGGWQRNTATSMYSFFANGAAALRKEGFAVFSISYRGLNADRVHMPEITADIFDALAYIAEHAVEYHVDPHEIYTIGHSAGAHLALLTAYMNKEELNQPMNICKDYTIRGVVAFSPPTLLSYEHMEEYVHAVDIRTLFDPADEDICRKFSPITYADRSCPPTFIAVGTADYLVPDFQGKELYQKLKDAGNRSQLEISIGGDHCFLKNEKCARPKPNLLGMVRLSCDFIRSLHNEK